MYSPKISENLVSALYWLAKSKRIPMTKLVNQIVAEYLLNRDMIEGGMKIYDESKEELGRL